MKQDLIKANNKGATIFFVVLYIFRKFKNVIWSVYNKSVTGKKDEFKFYEAPLIFFGLELGPNEGERGFIDPVVVLPVVVFGVLER